MPRRVYLITILSLLVWNNAVAATKSLDNTASNLGSVKGGDFKQAQTILSSKCTSCHTKDKIDIALSMGKDMNKIQLEMEKRGAKLNIKEREVLGIYWKQANPLRGK